MNSTILVLMNSTILVLTTVNAPHSEQLDAQTLAHCLTDQAAARAKPGHMSSFFGEVEPSLQLLFAEAFDISQEALVAAAKAFAEYSGESYPLAA
jgi:hypothetical protein